MTHCGSPTRLATAQALDLLSSQYNDAVAKTNMSLTVEHIREHSLILKKLEQEGKIKIVGSMYHLVGGEVEFLS